MRRSIKALFVIIGWSILFYVSCAIAAPIVLSFRDPIIQAIPLEFMIPALIMAMGISVPVLYGAMFLITPLFLATIEVFSDVSR